MQDKMIATAYGNVQIDWLQDLVSGIGIYIGITTSILNDGLNCVTTLNLGDFQSDSWHIRLQHHSIHNAIAKDEIEIKHVVGTEMLADDLTKVLGEVKLGKFV